MASSLGAPQIQFVGYTTNSASTVLASFASSNTNTEAIAFRVFNMKTEAGRKKKIETFVAMLARGETIHIFKPRAKS